MDQQQPQNTYVTASSMESAASDGVKRRRIITLLVVALIAVAGAASILIWNALSSEGVSAEEPAASVNITAEGFSPATIKIKKGEDVAWVNKDTTATHEVFADQTVVSGLDSTQPLAENDTYIFTFDKAGTYNYYDPLDPVKLKGTVIVE